MIKYAASLNKTSGSIRKLNLSRQQVNNSQLTLKHSSIFSHLLHAFLLIMVNQTEWILTQNYAQHFLNYSQHKSNRGRSVSESPAINFSYKTSTPLYGLSLNSIWWPLDRTSSIRSTPISSVSHSFTALIQKETQRDESCRESRIKPLKHTRIRFAET